MRDGRRDSFPRGKMFFRNVSALLLPDCLRKTGTLQAREKLLLRVGTRLFSGTEYPAEGELQSSQSPSVRGGELPGGHGAELSSKGGGRCEARASCRLLFGNGAPVPFVSSLQKAGGVNVRKECFGDGPCPGLRRSRQRRISPRIWNRKNLVGTAVAAVCLPGMRT